MIHTINDKNLYNTCPSVEHFNAYSYRELLQLFQNKLNEIINEFNRIEKESNSKFEEVENKLKYLLNEGLGIEVSKKLLEMYENGMLESIINETIFNNLSNKVNKLEELTNHYYYLSLNQNLGVGNDDTGILQTIIDNVRPNTVIIFDSRKTYHLNSIKITKSIVLDLNGCNIIANLKDKKSLFLFEGTRTKLQDISKINKYETSLTTSITDTCYIMIEDDTVVQGWDYVQGDGKGKYSNNYTGQGEVNILYNGVKLGKPTDFNYTNARVFKLNLIENIKVLGHGATITEIDNGEVPQTNNDTGSLFQFQYCLKPYIENVNINKWNTKICYFLGCIEPNAIKIQGQLPFRPEVGGHGYITQYVRCNNSFTSQCIGIGARHIVDYSECTDGYSCNNEGFNSKYAQYLTHGRNCKRITSQNDSAYNCECGWSVGNASFSSDYDINIIEPHFISSSKTSNAFMFTCKSDNIKVKGGFIKCALTLAKIMAGCSNIEFDGVEFEGIENINVTTFNIRDYINSDDTIKFYPKNLTIKNCKFYGYNAFNIICEGKLIIKNNYIENNNGSSSITINYNASNLTEFEFSNNTVKTTSEQAVKGYSKPQKFKFNNNIIDGLCYIACSKNMQFQNNIMSSFNFNNNPDTDILSTCFIKNNIPTLYNDDEYKIKYYSNITEIEIKNYRNIIIENSSSTSIRKIVCKKPKTGQKVTIYSYNSNLTILNTCKVYGKNEDDSDKLYGIKFKNENNIVFPAGGGAITLLCTGDGFVEINRNF